MAYPNTTYPNTPLHIDIPVKLDDVKVVFSVAALSFEGDLAASLFHLGLITNRIGWQPVPGAFRPWARM